jgi:phosphoribulokinase
MRVPKPAAGMITTTFIAGDQYKGGEEGVQIVRAIRRDIAHTVDAQVFLVPLVEVLWISRLEGKAANAGEASHKTQSP